MAKKGGSDDSATSVKLKELRRVCPAFHQLPVSKIEQLKQHSSKLNYPPGSVICRKGKPHDTVLYIQKGSVGLYAGEGAEGDVTLKSGAVFGEASLLVDSGEWAVTSVTKENTALVMMQKRHLEEAFNLQGRDLKVHVPDLARVALGKSPPDRSELDHQAVADAFGSQPLFKNMMPHTRDRCLKHLTLEDYAAQTCIFSQGEHTDYIVCILSGSVSLHVQEHLQRQASSEFLSGSSESDEAEETEDEAEAVGDAAAEDAEEEEDLFEDGEEDTFGEDAEGADSALGKPAELDASLTRPRRGSLGALGSTASACMRECLEEAQIDIVDMYGECVTVVYALDVLGEAALGVRERHTMSAVAREHVTVLRLPVDHFKEPPEEEVVPIPPQHVRRLMKDVRAEEAKELLPLLSFSAHLHGLAPHFRLALCKAFQYRSFPAGVNVVRERVVAAEMFIVLRGTLAVHQRKFPMAEEDAAVLDENGVSIAKPEEWRWWGDCKSLVGPGMCVKETALTQTFAQPSTYSVVTLCPTEVISLSKAAYNIVQRKTEEQVREGKVKMLRGVPAINNLPTESLERIVRCMQMKKPSNGEIIYRAGQPSSFTYLLRSGKCVSESKDPKTGKMVTTEHSPGEMLGIREVIFSVPYLATMKCAEDHTELLMNEAEDLSRHSKGILRGLNAYAPPPGMDLSLSKAPAAKGKKSNGSASSLPGDANPRSPLQHSQTMPVHGHNPALLAHSRSLPSGGNRTILSAKQRGGTPIGNYGSQHSTVPEKARNPMSWGFHTERKSPRILLACASPISKVAQEFGAFELSSPSSPDTPGVSSPAPARNQSPPRRNERISSDPEPPVPAWLRRSQQQLTRTHPVELTQNAATRSPRSSMAPAAAAPARRCTQLADSPRSIIGASHGAASFFTGSECMAGAARPTTSPGMGHIASMSRAGGGMADLWRPSTAQALMPEHAAASVPRAALGLCSGARPSRLAIPAQLPTRDTERGASRASLTPSSPAPGSLPAARMTAVVKARTKRDLRSENSDGARRSDTAQSLEYARRSMGIDPVLDPELRFMADVAWEAKKQHLEYDRMPDIDAHLHPEDLPTTAPAHVRFSREYYYDNSPMGPLRDQHDEYNRPRRLWNYSDAKDMKTQWTATPVRPRVPRPNAVTHQLASQDFKPELGGPELKLTCHVREVVPYSKFASHEKALMDFSRALMKRKTDEARKNAEAGKYDFND